MPHRLRREAHVVLEEAVLQARVQRRVAARSRRVQPTERQRFGEGYGGVAAVEAHLNWGEIHRRNKRHMRRRKADYIEKMPNFGKLAVHKSISGECCTLKETEKGVRLDKTFKFDELF